MVQDGEVPQDIQKLSTPIHLRAAITVELTKDGLAKSRSEARRLLSQGAIQKGGETVTEDIELSKEPPGQVIKVGKRRFAST